MVRRAAISQRRGSALLIVLGMVAFMVISAVAFSAYMRFSRLPSSFLRRNIASRMLVKAALASAIDEIDAAIGPNPHPGVGTKARRYPAVDGISRNRNFWQGRVYIGTNTSSSVSSPVTLTIPQSDTVSTLSLEGLAYLPPALVNEARYYSRHSLAGKWHTLPYDVGRYAFCAVDVSDYFDVNAMGADQARTSQADSRISLGYIFEDEEHKSIAGTWAPDAWDKMMSDSYKESGKVPLVSMADLNLVVNARKPSGMTSPFCEYVKNSYQNFYNSPDEEAKERLRRMMFVTDSYFPNDQSGSNAGPYYLDDVQNQPFGSIAQGQSAMTIMLNGLTSSRSSVWKHYIGLLGSCALYDYLDYDSVPCSLAIPTTERVPMVCGIQPALPSLSIAIKPTTSPLTKTTFVATANPNVEECQVTYSVVYKLDPTTFVGLSAAKLNTVLTYPFRHNDNGTQQFLVDGWMSLFLNTGTMGLRTGNLNDQLHFSDNLLSKNTYQVGFNNNAIISIPFTQQSLTFKPTSESDAVKDLPLSASAPSSIAADIDSRKLVEVTFTGTQQKTTDPNTGITTLSPTDEEIQSDPFSQKLASAPCNATVTATSDFIPLDENGNQDQQFVGQNLKGLLSGSTAVQANLNLAVWVRVRNSDGKTVDLVPACMTDDVKLGMYAGAPQVLMNLDNQFLGGVFPLLRFDTGVVINYGNNKVETPGSTAVAVTLAPTAAYVGDPRYNHAPEDWFAVSACSAADWLNQCHAHDAYRDGDIFMSVSDQGYLQSIYELANLPRLTQFYRSGASYGLGISGSELYVRADEAYSALTIPSEFSETAHRHVMWRTYDPFPRSGKYYDGGFPADYYWNSDGDVFDPTALDSPSTECFLAPASGYGVNPYSDSTNHLMAALANTPHEWRVAGTNENSTALDNVPAEATQFNPKYAWNEYSSGARLQWVDLEDLAGMFMKEIRKSPSEADITNLDKDWKQVWDNLPWRDPDASDAPTQELCGLKLGDTSSQGLIYNTDKKFLYGYWRDCFAVRQQLFLIFVRAEPAMMGGESISATPPQLGAKAVALVWRNPSGPNDVNKPHQTRVLFYRQFDN